MKKVILFLCGFILISNNVFSNESINADIDFFLGQKFLNDKKYVQSEFFFNRILEGNNIYTDCKVKKAFLYLILLKVKGKNFKGAEHNIKSFLRVHNERDKLFNYVSFFYSLISYLRANQTILDKLIFLFDEDKAYNEKFLKRSYKHFLNITDKNLFPVNLYYMGEKVKSRLTKHQFLLVEYYIKKKAYISAYRRLKKISTNDNNLKLRKKFLLCKLYNEMFLDREIIYKSLKVK